MKLLVAYASKYGMAKEYAEAIAMKGGAGSRSLDLAAKEARHVDFSAYDAVVVGASVYAGRARSAMRAFLKNRGKELMGKEYGLFLCGLASGDEARRILSENIPEELRSGAKALAYLPGWIQREKVNAFERFITDKISESQAKAGKEPPRKPDLKSSAAEFAGKMGL